MTKKISALVCGASQGIGAAIAQELAKAGVQVFALARSKDKLARVVAGLPNVASGKHVAITQDLADVQGLKNQISTLLSTHGSIQVLINNTGGPKAGSLLQAEDQEFIQAFSDHVVVSQNLAKLLVPGMKTEGFGRIINIISTSVKVPINNLGVSNTIRAAMANWAKTMSQELGPFGITVNNVLPGYTLTPRFESLRKTTSEKLKISEDEVEKMWKSTMPTGRFVTPEEIAWAVGFLSSEKASSITGINLPVDGGRTPTL